LPVAGSSGICPEKYTVLPARTACEYGPMAAGAWSVWMICLVIRDSCVDIRILSRAGLGLPSRSLGSRWH